MTDYHDIRDEWSGLEATLVDVATNRYFVFLTNLRMCTEYTFFFRSLMIHSKSHS